MPQDKLRSAVYRSFVTCDDPKGVIDCGTIRRYRNGPGKMKHKVEAQQASNEFSRGTEEFHSCSSLQLMEVSRGAQKLNQMISSLSRRRSFDGQSEDVAKDLLKGALDLQQSLAMLGRLQEASKYMTQLKKQKDKNLGIGRSRSDRFMSQNNLGGFEKPRLSLDGPSRDCIEQLREAIKDGFTKQKELLLHNTRTLGSEMASTSSSQSSTDHSKSKRFGSPVSSLSPSALQKKPKGPNLIAKLMGLEEIPLKPVQAESKQILSQLKPKCDNDSMKEPIVLIRPIHARLQDSESQRPTFQEEESSSMKLFFRKPKVKDEHRPKIVSCNETSLKKKMLRKEVEQETLSKKVCNGPKVEVKAQDHKSHKEQKNEAIVKRVDKIHKVSGATTKPVEKETLRSQDQATKQGKSENGSSNRPHLISKSTRQPISGHKKNHTKPREKPESAQRITENLARQERKKINTRSEKETHSTLTDGLCTEEESAASELHIEAKPEHETDTETAKEDLGNAGEGMADSKSLRTFLLSNPSFLCQVEELFHLNLNFPLVSQVSNLKIANEELCLDFAKEFVKRRSLPDSRTIHPLLLACTGNARIWVSLDRLMEEVCDAVESYSSLGGEDCLVDNLCAVSERDIHSNGVVNGAWDLGWRSGFSVDEAERVVKDLEKLLFSGLIEEAFG